MLWLFPMVKVAILLTGAHSLLHRQSQGWGLVGKYQKTQCIMLHNKYSFTLRCGNVKAIIAHLKHNKPAKLGISKAYLHKDQISGAKTE